MGKIAKLIMVTGDNNNNKFYDMVENADGSITSTWGRVDVTSTVTHYPAGTKKWDSLLNSKVKKGYVDVTALRAVQSTKSDFSKISDYHVAGIVDELQAYANASVQHNYTISAEAVTPQMVAAAQVVINDLVPLVAVGSPAKSVNDKLLEMYRIIPRKMKNTKLHLLDFDTLRDDNIERARELLSNEQAILDVMSGQVQVSQARSQVTSTNSKTILDAMGIDISAPSDQDIARVKKYLGENAKQFSRAFRVENKKTQARFDRHVQGTPVKLTMQFWHGSRNENWWSILDSGLVLRPTSAVRTGSMFGTGLYFADLARKSIGYTSLSGSYWAKGLSQKGFLAVYEVHLGNPLKVKHHQSWCSSLTKNELRKKGAYDSLFAEGGADLRNNEYIVYDEAQCTVKFLVEIV